MEFQQVMECHQRRYPQMQAQDWAKLCYQSEFGAGHLVTDPAACLKRLKDEYEHTLASQEELFEPLGSGLCRLHLGPLHGENVRLETVARLFRMAAEPRGTLEGMKAKLAEVEQLAPDAYYAAYRAEDCPMVSHTPAYRSAYQPAYRVVPQWAQEAWPMIRALDQLLAAGKRVIAAIDGMSGSGKSTMAAHLNKLFEGNLFHMDDFFLPFERKTPERLAQPGGNVDYERFRQEVLDPLERGKAFAYRPFQCWNGALGAPVHVENESFNLVEGCYSLHPLMNGSYDYRAFLGLDPQEQSRRILERNGPEMHQRFIREWIPMENHYLEHYHIRALCDWVR